MTARDIGRPIPTIPFRRPNPRDLPYAQPVMADDVVRYVGEPVAVVLADSPERAEDAPARSRSTSSICRRCGPRGGESGRGALFDVRDAELRDGVHREQGDAAEAFRAALHIRREQFRVQRMTAMTMETRGLLAEWDAATGA